MKSRILFVLMLSFALVLSSFSQNKWLNELGVINPAMPKNKLLDPNNCYFEILQNATVGTEVVGRVGLANNSFQNAEFEITGGSGVDYFSITRFVNSRGKNFGVIKTKQLLSDNSYTLKVKARFADGTSDEQLYTITRVKSTIAANFYTFVYNRLSCYGDMYTSVADATLAGYISKMAPNGSFSDLTIGVSNAGWNGIAEGAKRLNGIAMAYLKAGSAYYNNEEIKQKLYTAIIFHSTEFAKFRTQWYVTQLWQNADYIGGIGINLYAQLRTEMNSADSAVAARAVAVYDAILDNCDIMFAERMNQRPAIANANRNHRLRCLAVRAAMTYDYNRAITDWDLWYDPIDPRIPGYYPSGAYRDIMQIVETSFVEATTYVNRDGFFPDGTICHHPDVGIQFTANDYSWGWLTEWSILLANQLKNTIYRAKNETYDKIANGLLDSYRPLTFNGYLDALVGGFTPDRSKWGGNLLGAINGLIDAKSDNTTIARESELLECLTRLQTTGYKDPQSINKAMWNLEYMMQQRSDYSVSLKLMSQRSRGLERGIDYKSYYYLGDGALLVRVNPEDYNKIQNHYNWHGIPGTTAEQRDIAVLPLDATSGFEGANGTNTFAGVASNGSIGMGAFIYERNHSNPSDLYSTVNANKGYFFFDREIVALGNKIRRVRAGDNGKIWTTINQLEWKGDVYYGNDSVQNIQTINLNSNGVNQELSISGPTWFYHDKVGYVIVPQNNQTINLKLIAESRDYQFPFKANLKKKMSQLAINHGNNPTNDSYQYIVLPGTTQQAVQQFAQSAGQTTSPVKVLKNDSTSMAVYHSQLNVIQIAFYQAGTFEFVNHSGEKVRINSDRQSLVMMKDVGDSLEFVVTDPNHSMTNTQINLKVNIKLKDQLFDDVNSESTIAFNHSSQEVLAGKPIMRRFKKEQSFINKTSGLNPKSEGRIVIDQFERRIRIKPVNLDSQIAVQLFNISGQMLWNEKIKPHQPIVVSNQLPFGIYILKIDDNQTKTCSKIHIY